MVQGGSWGWEGWEGATATAVPPLVSGRDGPTSFDGVDLEASLDGLLLRARSAHSITGRGYPPAELLAEGATRNAGRVHSAGVY